MCELPANTWGDWNRIKAKFVDPIRDAHRKQSMFTESAPTMHGRVAIPLLCLETEQGIGMAKDGAPTNAMSEAPWVAEMQRISARKDEQAFAALFEHFAPRVKAFLMKSGSSEALAEECAQDVMATVWHKSHLFDAERASVATWIFTIARNRKIDQVRKINRPEPEDLPWGPEEEPDPSDVLSLQQERARVAEALAALPEKQRFLVEKAFYGDLSHSEIATQTGLPLGTIKSRIRLALERLRHAMK